MPHICRHTLDDVQDALNLLLLERVNIRTNASAAGVGAGVGATGAASAAGAAGAAGASVGVVRAGAGVGAAAGGTSDGEVLLDDDGSQPSVIVESVRQKHLMSVYLGSRRTIEVAPF